MNSRRKRGGFLGTPAPDDDYVPSKTDLFNLLDGLRFKKPPEIIRAREALDSAIKARRTFERSNKTWKLLREAERTARRELQQIENLEQDRWADEIAECRAMLRLYGVTSAVKQRIEKLVYGDEEE